MFWYVRTENTVKGPFPEKQIQESVLLGRLNLETPVSKDKDDWQALRFHPELIPEVMQADPADPQARERLKAARRWADERRKERRDEDLEDPARLGPGRRVAEPYTVKEYRDNREDIVEQFKPRDRRVYPVIAAIVVLLLLGVYAGFTLTPDDQSAADCTAVPAPGVNWRHCQFPGRQILNQDFSHANLNSINLQGAKLVGGIFDQADLSYANLSLTDLSLSRIQHAMLKGTDLRQADLSGVNFTASNLAYANLTGAIIDNASFRDVILDQAIWVDGRICANGSVGVCRQNSSTR